MEAADASPRTARRNFLAHVHRAVGFFPRRMGDFIRLPWEILPAFCHACACSLLPILALGWR